MYAIISTGGKQLKVTNDEVVAVERLAVLADIVPYFALINRCIPIIITSLGIFVF